MGGVILQIRRFTATFGRLDRQTLELSGGLNILNAPNETGKSTWCAFLSAMLYGINSRERDRAGFLAEKNRYAPWNGAAMEGRIDCLVGDRELTLTRETKRQTAPMGSFSACYTGTGDAVPGLTGQNCGEVLLGVPQEIFERSALIRQSGLGVTQDAELEKRILSLIVSGEEDTSYSEAAAALRKQLNRRRHNRTGQIPSLEAELEELSRKEQSLRGQQAELTELARESAALTARQTALTQLLSQCDRCEAAQKRKIWLDAEQAALRATTDAETLHAALDADQIPDSETISRLRGAIVNLETIRKSVETARVRRSETQRKLSCAEAAVSASLFAGQSAESVRREVQTPPAVRPPLAVPCMLGFLGLLLAASLGFLLWPRGAVWSIGCGVGLLAITALLVRARYTTAKRKAQAAALVRRFGVSDPQQISAQADAYVHLLQEQKEAQTNAESAAVTADSLTTSLTSNEQAILLNVRRFAPTAFDIPAADSLLQQCGKRRMAWNAAEAAAREARLRHELLAQQSPPVPAAPEGGEPNDASLADRDTLEAQLAQTQTALASLQSRSDHLSGQIAATGDPAVLEAREAQLRQQVESLEDEYRAITLALEALDTANTTLQSRFSPELGRRTAEIFSGLTGGRYAGVVLDRTFHLSAEPTGDSVYRDAQFLSAGTLDQLYLAVRLAICELVLPLQSQIPLILDDALTNFDDERCHAALRWLRKEAETRQILLFTCHSREAAFFQNDPAVSIQELTASLARV